MTLSTHHLTAELIHTLINHELPALQSLDLSLKSAEEQTSIEDSVQELILQLDAPRLKHLRIQQTPYSNRIARLLSKSQVLEQLETLDLSNGSLTDEGAQAIIEFRHCFSHLQRLDLRHNWLVDTPRILQEWGPSIFVTDQHPWENLRLRR